MKKAVFCCVLSVFVAISSASGGEKPIGNVLVSLDFTEALVGALTAETGITLTRALPRNYTPATHDSYLKKHYADFATKAKLADCVVGLASLWPDDPLYPWARRANIRIVPIDAGLPLSGLGAGVPLLNRSSASSDDMESAVWASPGNATRMADIVGADLMQLFPQQSADIRKNQDRLKRALFQLRSRYEKAFSNLDTFEIVALTDRFLYLTNDLGLMQAEVMLKPEIDWKEGDVDHLKETITSGQIRGVLCAWQPNTAITAAIEQSGAHVIVLSSFTLQESKGFSSQLLAYYSRNLEVLLGGLR